MVGGAQMAGDGQPGQRGQRVKSFHNHTMRETGCYVSLTYRSANIYTWLVCLCDMVVFLQYVSAICCPLPGLSPL